MHTNRLGKVKSLAARIDPQLYKDITVFVDPIDGTREFATGSNKHTHQSSRNYLLFIYKCFLLVRLSEGDCVTILIGYNDKNGVPCAGIMYRPLTEPQTW